MTTDSPPPCFGRDSALVFHLAQPWRTEPEADLRPTRVEARFSAGALHVIADLEDEDVFNLATSHNQRTWELGDVFEIFVRRDDSESYTEVHVTPDNIRLHLRFADFAQVARVTDIAAVAADPAAIASAVERSSRGWRVLVTVPVAADLGDVLRLSFCRYDWTRGRAEPVLSSSSPHPVLAFHRPTEWLACRIVD